MVARSADPRLGFSATGGPSVGLVAGLAASGIATAALLSPARVDQGPVLCPFRRLTGLPCPGCGLTRSWVDLMHGHVVDAMAVHPFGAVTLALAGVLVVAVGTAVVRRTPLPTYAEVFARSRGRRRLLAAIVVAWLAFAAGRLVAVVAA